MGQPLKSGICFHHFPSISGFKNRSPHTFSGLPTSRFWCGLKACSAAWRITGSEKLLVPKAFSFCTADPMLCLTEGKRKPAKQWGWKPKKSRSKDGSPWFTWILVWDFTKRKWEVAVRQVGDGTSENQEWFKGHFNLMAMGYGLEWLKNEV